MGLKKGKSTKMVNIFDRKTFHKRFILELNNVLTKIAN